MSAGHDPFRGRGAGVHSTPGCGGRLRAAARRAAQPARGVPAHARGRHCPAAALRRSRCSSLAWILCHEPLPLVLPCIMSLLAMLACHSNGEYSCIHLACPALESFGDALVRSPTLMVSFASRSRVWDRHAIVALCCSSRITFLLCLLVEMLMLWLKTFILAHCLQASPWRRLAQSSRAPWWALTRSPPSWSASASQRAQRLQMPLRGSSGRPHRQRDQRRR